MKKKIVALCVIVCMLAVAIVGGTLAFFTDNETATNTFTVGNVDITLNETDNSGNAFQQNQKLYPGDSEHNAIAKNVTVTATKGDSWVWVDILVPVALYPSQDEKIESYNGLHFNQFINYVQGYTTDSTNANAKICAAYYNNSDHQWSVATVVNKSETINGVDYVRLRTTHKDIVLEGSTTSPAISQVYMDKNVTYDAKTGKYMVPNGSGTGDTPSGFNPYSGSWEILVQAYAMQSQGFSSVDDAIKAYK